MTCACCNPKAAYVVGLVMLGVSVKLSLWGTFFLSWVYRIGGTASATRDTVEYYGLFTACSTDAYDLCQHIFEGLPEVKGAARGAQALLVVYFCLASVCFVFEILSCISCLNLKNKFAPVFENRIIEYTISVGAVMGFMGMLVFAAEVKNKASRDIGQEDQTGLGFGFSITAQLLTVIGCCVMTCGRPKPRRKEIDDTY